MGLTPNGYGNEDDSDYQYNNSNAYHQQSMRMKPNDDEWIPPPNKRDDYNNYGNNLAMKVRPEQQWVQPPNNYNKLPGMQMVKSDQWPPPPPKPANYQYGNGSPMRMEADPWVPPPDDDYQYYNNNNNNNQMQMKPNQQWVQQPEETIKGGNYQYYNNSSMQMKPNQWVPPPQESIRGNDYEYYNNNSGSSMPMKSVQQWIPPPSPQKQMPRQMRPEQWAPPPQKQMPMQMKPEQWGPPPPRHNYHQQQMQYPEDQQYDNWNNSRNKYPGHGKQVNAYQYTAPMADDVIEYGADEGDQLQYHYAQTKGGGSSAPTWRAKGVKD